MFDQVPFETVAGPKTPGITMLALSTCGFCRRGQEFLESHGLGYRFVHLDTIDPEVKARVKAAFKEKFGVTLSYPALVVEGGGHTIGYVKRQWEDLLGLPHEDEVSEAEPL